MTTPPRTIAVVKQTGSSTTAYDEKGKYLFSVGGKLAGHTTSTVSIKSSGNRVSIYDVKGRYSGSV
jgi:hypothetical protein